MAERANTFQLFEMLRCRQHREAASNSSFAPVQTASQGTELFGFASNAYQDGIPFIRDRDGETPFNKPVHGNPDENTTPDLWYRCAVGVKVVSSPRMGEKWESLPTF